LIALDTNVLIRYITQDDEQQAAQATRTIENECSRSDPGFISLIVLCEVAWVLRGAYKYAKTVVIRVIEQILLTAELTVDEPALAWAALRDYEKSAADYADCLIARIAKDHGCTCTVTFDRRTAGIPGFKVLL
jgi:predicted nucleic-acid-binding protein